MKKILVTGATGFIGQRLAMQLAAENCTVHVLFRDETKKQLLNHPGICFFKGSILNTDSLQAALEGVEEVYHLAALAKPWSRDPQTFYQVNVQGSENVFDAAWQAGARRVVYTSTAGLIGPSGETPIDETYMRQMPYFTDYEHSKQQITDIIRIRASRGENIVAVSPPRVYGPGLLSVSNGVTRMIKYYLQGRFRFIPGDGSRIGNYVFIDDVVRGHILAMAHGRAGETYILGGENVSFDVFFEKLANVSGIHRHMIHLPLSWMQAASTVMEKFADLTGIAPLITPAWVNKYLNHWALSSEKAERELGYTRHSLEAGMEKTVAWLRSGERWNSVE